MLPRKAAFVALLTFLTLLPLAWALSAVSLRQDDLGYLAWAFEVRDQPLAWLRGPAWLSYWRPWNALGWWLSGTTGSSGEGARALLVALWSGTLAALVRAGARRGLAAAGVAALALLGAQVFVDLLAWRSWLSTTGTLCGLALGIVALDRDRPRPVWLLAAGLLALGFKETGAFALGALALLRGPGACRSVGGLLVALALGSASGSASKLGLAHLPGNLAFHLETLGLFAWATPLLVAARWPRAPGLALVAAAGAALLPLKLAGGVVALGVVASLWPSAELLAAAIALGPPLLGAAQARQYALESWLLVASALALRRPTRGLALGLAALAALPSAVDFARGRAPLRAAWVEQRQFFADFDPAPAAALYHPDPGYAYDLDMLVWLSRGAVWRGAPPEGTAPRQVGPRSGVWADLLPDQRGEGSSTTAPR